MLYPLSRARGTGSFPEKAHARAGSIVASVTFLSARVPVETNGYDRVSLCVGRGGTYISYVLVHRLGQRSVQWSASSKNRQIPWIWIWKNQKRTYLKPIGCLLIFRRPSELELSAPARRLAFFFFFFFSFHFPIFLLAGHSVMKCACLRRLIALCVNMYVSRPGRALRATGNPLEKT